MEVEKEWIQPTATPFSYKTPVMANRQEQSLEAVIEEPLNLLLCVLSTRNTSLLIRTHALPEFGVKIVP